ncbi:MAG: ATPase [Helicobacteraceae bacterium 4484_230]|nr:MAG: ATPase [Helicobacteraceae bacterium 4484_230]
MIERFYLRSCLSFDQVELDLKHGLIVFSGPSGSGKSVLMSAILASVGFGDAMAQISESSVLWKINEQESGFINEEPNVFRQVKREKVRFFVNNQSVSRRVLCDLSNGYLRHLSLKDYSDFEQEKLIGLLDDRIMLHEPEYAEKLNSYKEIYTKYRHAVQELETLRQKEKNINELKEFAEFELSKISGISPKPGEYEHLQEIKRSISQKEKSQEKITQAEAIFEHEHKVAQALDGIDVDTAFFDDAMNELRSHFEKALNDFSEVENIDIEEVLDRLEQLSDLKRRYGSIEEAIAYAQKKAKEVDLYENFDREKQLLQKEADRLYETLVFEAAELTSKRKDVLKEVNSSINSYLEKLYLEGAELMLKTNELDRNGADSLLFELKGAPLDKISSGEFNRLRLAILAARSESMKEHGGVLMLDEIDANLSGEESMSVAVVLKQLSRNFQIFVISHQPQLTSMGDQHFLVTKDGQSRVKELDRNERISEIARMVSGEKITNEALVYAKELMEGSECV